MPSPFPGMDPYLESPAFWSEVHNRLIVAIADDLAPKLRPRYRVAIEQRIYLSSADETQLVVPDVAITQPAARPENSGVATLSPPAAQPISIALELPEEMRESYLEIREVATGRVVTVLEILSPKNKRRGEGRVAYERKRLQVLASATHFVEIDLLRRGRAFPLGQVAAQYNAQYYVLVARGDRRPNADLYPFTLRESLPSFLLPLAGADAAPVVPLQALFTGVYDRAGFDLAIDYGQPLPKPSLSAADAAWAEASVLSNAGRS
jgi:Protein of unknown function (DUF4058)